MFKAASVSNDFGIIDKGEYEAYVSDCGFSQTKSGEEFISFEFTIRSDIQQKFKNRRKSKAFFKDFETKDYAKNTNGEYKFCEYATRLGIAPGKGFELEDLIGKNCVIVINHYKDKNTGETKDCIFYIKPSKEEGVVKTLGNAVDDELEEYDDEFDGDLPFD